MLLGKREVVCFDQFEVSTTLREGCIFVVFDVLPKTMTKWRLIATLLVIVSRCGWTLNQPSCYGCNNGRSHSQWPELLLRIYGRSGRSTATSSKTPINSVVRLLAITADAIPSDYQGFDDSVNIDNVSDAEALLACRAFLQRKNRLGWQQAKERKALREQTGEKESFWDSSEYVTYWNKREEEDIDFDQGEDFLAPVEEIVLEEQSHLGIFTEMPTGPNERSEIRSRVKKEQWQDPEFRSRWYASRWGDHVKLTDESKKQLKLQTKLLDIPSAILDSPEFSMLTEDEIDEAITSYVRSNRKRSVARKIAKMKQVLSKTKNVQSNDIGDNAEKPLHRDSLFAVSEDQLREEQRRRSVRAQKAYQTRLKSVAKSKMPRSPSKRNWISEGKSPSEALRRIVADLDASRCPNLVDVELIMKASKLSRRKEILLRILKEQFNLRGKCLLEENAPEIYVTQASICQLGRFVIQLLKERATQ